MTAVVRTPPRPDRTDVGLAAFSRWHVGSPREQAATLEAITRAWRSRPWPSPELRSYNLYAGNDGRTLMHYSQWADEKALREFQHDQRDERLEEIFAAVPEVERLRLGLYTRYRGGILEPANGPERRAGCIVTVEVEFESPDAERQRNWVDAVYTALETDPKPHPGAISAQFHVSTDGTRVLNYAEWESEQAHVDALAEPGDGAGPRTPEWQRVRNFPGMKSSSVTRYTFARSIVQG